MESRILWFNMREFVYVWSFMSFYEKWWNWWFLVWNVVNICYKLYFHVYYAYTCLKLSFLCFGMLKFQDLRGFHQKPENRVLLFLATRHGECAASEIWCLSVQKNRPELALWAYQCRKLLFCWINEIYVYTMFGLRSYDYVMTYVIVVWALMMNWVWYHTCWLNDNYYDWYDDGTFVHV
jgi:hypothetical protein